MDLTDEKWAIIRPSIAKVIKEGVLEAVCAASLKTPST
jgi:hypothetical protein